MLATYVQELQAARIGQSLPPRVRSTVSLLAASFPAVVGDLRLAAQLGRQHALQVRTQEGHLLDEADASQETPRSL